MLLLAAQQQRPQRGYVLWQRGGVQRRKHARICHDRFPFRQVFSHHRNDFFHPASSGRQVRAGIRQSMPSSNIDSCAGVRKTAPSLAWGQTKRPFSRRFANRQRPCPSHHNTLIRSPRRPRKTSRWPPKGSLERWFWARDARPSNPRRRSVCPQASQTCTFGGGAIIPATRRSRHATSRQLCPGGSELCHPTAERLQLPRAHDLGLKAERVAPLEHHSWMTPAA